MAFAASSPFPRRLLGFFGAIASSTIGSDAYKEAQYAIDCGPSADPRASECTARAEKTRSVVVWLRRPADPAIGAPDVEAQLSTMVRVRARTAAASAEGGPWRVVIESAAPADSALREQPFRWPAQSVLSLRVRNWPATLRPVLARWCVYPEGGAPLCSDDRVTLLVGGWQPLLSILGVLGSAALVLWPERPTPVPPAPPAPVNGLEVLRILIDGLAPRAGWSDAETRRGREILLDAYVHRRGAPSDTSDAGAPGLLPSRPDWQLFFEWRPMLRTALHNEIERREGRLAVDDRVLEQLRTTLSALEPGPAAPVVPAGPPAGAPQAGGVGA